MPRWAMTRSGGVWVSHWDREVLVDVALEHFEEFEVGVAGVLEVVGQGFLDVADVAGLEVHGAGAATGGEDGHAAFAGHEVFPFVGVLVPVEFMGKNCLERNLVDETGVEPATSSLRTMRSPN